MSEKLSARKPEVGNWSKAAIKEAFHISDLSPRRLLNVEDAAAYLSLSEREVYNMISNKDLAAVRHGRRVMLDIRDLELWIQDNKVLR